MKLVEHKGKLVQCGWIDAPVEASEDTHFHLKDSLWIGMTIDDFAQGLVAAKSTLLARCGVELDSEEESGGGQGLVRVQNVVLIVERIGVDRSVAIKVVHCHCDDLANKVKVDNEFIIPGLQMKRLD